MLADIAAIDFGDWETRLLRRDSGKLLPCYENVALYLQHSPDWAGVLGYNEFTGGYFVLQPPPTPITAAAGSELDDAFDIQAVQWCERTRANSEADWSGRVVDVVARRNTYHPVRDYLESLPPCGRDAADSAPG